MSRPRRLASQKVYQEPKLDLSDVEESDDDADFSSQSSDEYNPDKSNAKEETFEESDEGDPSEDIESSDEENSPVKQSSRRSLSLRNNNKSIATLKKSPINRFNLSSSNMKLKDILSKAQFNKAKKPSIFSQSDDDGNKTPTFDCSGGLRLSDSSDSESEENIRPSTSQATLKKSSNLTKSINEESGKPMVDLKTVNDNLQKLKNVREKLANYNPNNANEKSLDNSSNDTNVANLLAMGENSKKPGASQKRSKKASQAEESDSDNWEEVEEDDSVNNYKGPKEGVEILLNEFGEQHTSKQSKPVDIEAQMKRKFNRVRKEHQENLHKTELMCWMAHGNYVNKCLNNPELMNEALKMLPKTKDKAQCYPNEKTDIDYFKQITKWFKQTIALRNTSMYCNFKTRPPLLTSLALQMKFKGAISRRDYVLIFVALLRAIGVQCRVVQSLVMDPKICPKSDLMSLSKKEEKSTKSTSKSSKSSKSSSKNSKKSSSKSAKSKKSAEKLKVSQLDGADDIPKDAKHKKTIKIKGLAAYRNSLEESFVDIDQINRASSTPKNLTKEAKAAQQMSPKVQLTLSSSNQNKSSLSDKLKKNSQAAKLSQLLSPRKTRSASRETDRTRNNENIVSRQASKSTKVDEIKKNKTLMVFSPRRLRSRSRSTDIEPNKSLDLKTRRGKKAVNMNNRSMDQQNKSAAELNNSKDQHNKSDPAKKPNLKALSRNPEKQKETLKVFSPMRLRSRSRSVDTSVNSSMNDARNTSRKRQITAKNDKSAEMNKKPKVTAESVKKSKKRATTSKDNSASEPKKAKKTVVRDEENEFSDDSLKYFKSISSSSSKNTPKSANREKKVDPQPSTSRANIDRRILSSDDEAVADISTSPRKSKGRIDIWVEAYSEKDEKWISIDIFRTKVDCVKEICQKATHPLVYAFAWNNDMTIKDVSARYCSNLNTTVRKMRVDQPYLISILNIYNHHFVRTTRDFKEDEELNKVLFDVPMPKSIAEFKNHPLYVLKRHLLKFQAIFPPEPPILGYIRDEAIYPRDCCFICHSRETWVKEARVVKLNEKPYKIVKTMKWDRAKNKVIKDVPLELFGVWQTKEYEPPVAENGIVPRNAYGNVELFKPCMLPINTVHIQLPGLNKVCKKLNIDCAQAIVGFDSSGGWPYPVYDGFIVCKEFEEKVIDAWTRDQEEAEKKEREKTEKRVYGNWKKLIKGLLIRERLMNKYNNFEEKQ